MGPCCLLNISIIYLDDVTRAKKQKKTALALCCSASVLHLNQRRNNHAVFGEVLRLLLRIYELYQMVSPAVIFSLLSKIIYGQRQQKSGLFKLLNPDIRLHKKAVL